jgi:hypothetical protein
MRPPTPPPSEEPVDLPRPPPPAYRIRSRAGTASQADVATLRVAIEDAGERGFASRLPFDTFLAALSPWVEPTVLRGLMLADRDPEPGTEWVMAFVPMTAELEPRWYVLPRAHVGTVPTRFVAVALEAEDYAVLNTHGMGDGYAELCRRLAERFPPPDDEASRP